jgi:hypothetical protein
MTTDLQARLDAALAENKRLRETNNRLNRRCQTYERGLAEKIEKGRTEGSLGRALANAAATKTEAENERLRAALESNERNPRSGNHRMTRDLDRQESEMEKDYRDQ